MTSAAAVVQMLVRLTGVILIILGALIWTGRGLPWILIHVVIGLVFVILLWVQAGLAARSRAGMGLVGAEIVWGAAVLVLGMTQVRLLPGRAHWVIQLLHLLVGLGAIGFAERIGGVMRRAKALDA